MACAAGWSSVHNSAPGAPLASTLLALLDWMYSTSSTRLNVLYYPHYVAQTLLILLPVLPSTGPVS